jgi:glycogen phosphorylase
MLAERINLKLAMSNPLYTQLPVERSEEDALRELALNLRWTWNHSADELWGRLDPVLWDLTQNPWIVLQTVSQERLREAWADAAFRQRVEELQAEQRAAGGRPRWFQSAHGDAQLRQVAYFSMEYMLSEALPIYSGGLGNVAGDQLKAASDLGVPVVGVGLLYQQGYFRQEIDPGGAQEALYPFNEPGQLPIRPVREANGEWLRLPLATPGLTLWIRTWQVRVGGITLYLLDTNDAANPPAFRGITSELYGGGPDTRIRQELVLGIGGWRLLEKLGLAPEVCHLNEGHAAFVVLERARCFMERNHVPFEAALAATRVGNVFTTHTAVDAGFDRFPAELLRKYLSRYCADKLKLPLENLLAMGRRNGGDDGEPFNMAFLAMRGCGAVNGVSRLHGEVSRRLFQPLFPRWPQSEVPVGHVTNGIHTPTWESATASRFWNGATSADRWLGELEALDRDVRAVPDEQIWDLRSGCCEELIGYVRKKVARQRATQGVPAEEIAAAERMFRCGVLTIGFARRFATYKRPNLLLTDPARLLRILTDRERPVQLIVAGKAHPEDRPGQELIRQWTEFIRRPEAAEHTAFLSDYDMLMAQQLVQGVDVWINTPRRPWEASGTSGMKILVNGGLNLSELDGWWAEGYAPEVGWAIGDGLEHDSDPAWDRAEAEQLYRILEQEIVPAFYTRDERGIPRAWVAKMRESMARLAPQFSANRTVREYTESYYLLAAAEYCRRAAEGGKVGAEIAAWERKLAEAWPRVSFGQMQVRSLAGEYEIETWLSLDDLASDEVRVEVYAEPGFQRPMERNEASAGGYKYSVRVPADRPAADYTPRVIPVRADARVPLEAAEVAWQK